MGELQLLQSVRCAYSTSCLVFRRCFPASPPCVSATAMLLLLSQGMKERKPREFLEDQSPRGGDQLKHHNPVPVFPGWEYSLLAHG